MIDAVLDAWLTTGRFNDAFEALAAFVGTAHALTVNSGSSANLVAFSTLTSPKLGERAIKPGDEVITVAAGFPTTVNPIIQNGAVPVFVDVTLPGYNIDVAMLEAALSPRTKAIMIAHTLGNPFDLDAVCAFAEATACGWSKTAATPSAPPGRAARSAPSATSATLSFYPAHHITMGEGGAVLTSDPRCARSPNPSATGAATAGASPAATTPAASASAGSWAACPRATTTSTPTATSATT
jgi:CDP-6-deoxy-D-xylo-4-hexulose-3-dehydrase